MNHRLTIKQGTVLPATGIGTGYLFLIIFIILAYDIGYPNFLLVPQLYILLVPWALMQFSYKDIIFKKSTHYYIKYRILFSIPLIKKRDLNDYHYFVLQKVRKTYRVQQGAAPGISVNEGNIKEHYYAINGFDKSTKELTEICKGTVPQLNQVIKENIQPAKIPVYIGARKKGYEYVPK